MTFSVRMEAGRSSTVHALQFFYSGGSEVLAFSYTQSRPINQSVGGCPQITPMNADLFEGLKIARRALECGNPVSAFRPPHRSYAKSGGIILV
jgi:hypothetical protein